MRFSSPTGFTRRCPRSAPRKGLRDRLPWSSIPYSASSRESLLAPGLPHPVRSASRVSHPLDGLLLSTASRPCFMPETLMGFQPFRGFPSRGAARPHRSSRAFLAFSPARCLQPWSEGGGRFLPRHLGFREKPFTRLQGLALPESPFTPAEHVRLRRRPVPSWAFSSLGSTSTAEMQRISPPLLSRA
jgi:hypothetical protein